MTKNLDDIGLKSVADHYDLFFIDLWGIDRSRVNIGIPYFSTEFWLQKSEEPSWNGLSEKCPNMTVWLGATNRRNQWLFLISIVWFPGPL